MKKSFPIIIVANLILFFLFFFLEFLLGLTENAIHNLIFELFCAIMYLVKGGL